MEDSEKLSRASADTMTKGMLNAIGGINYQMIMFLIIIYVLLSSDTFINGVLSKISGAVTAAAYPTSYGVFVQSMFLATMYLIIDALQKNEVI